MEIRAGFEPAINSFADCPLEPLEYRIMAGIAGFEPAVPVSKTGALTPWLYPIVMVIRAGLEPSITALKGLCPDQLDERTILGSGLPVLCNRSHQNIIYADMKQCRKNDQIINSRERSPVLPFVNCLRRIETENHLQVVNGQACGLSQINNIGAGLRKIDGWNRQPKHLLF